MKTLKDVSDREFKELVSDICSIIDEVDDGLEEGEEEGLGIHINEIKATLSEMGYNLSPELF